jgi:tRNA 2-thiouridine synthesizing protein A
LPAGPVLRLLASDEMAAIDLPHFCAEAGHTYLGASPVAGGAAYLLRSGQGLPRQDQQQGLYP